MSHRKRIGTGLTAALGAVIGLMLTATQGGAAATRTGRS